MKAYFFDDISGDPRLPHETSEVIPESHLAELGLIYQFLPVDGSKTLKALKVERNYKNEDQITISPKALGDKYDGKIKIFFQEHMHEDEEIRYVLKGGGYFDVRERGDSRWVRIAVEEGDLLVLPAGVYHRFTVNEGNYIKAMRLFKDEPKWTPLNRGLETEAHPIRKEYVASRDGSYAS